MVKWRLRVFWALLLAVVSIWTVKSYLTSLEETAPVLLATQEIPARAQITAEMVKVVVVKKSDLSQLAADALSSPDQVVGRYARRLIPQGEILRDRSSDFTTEAIRPAAYEGEGALADFLPSTARAVTVKLDAQGVLGQHVKPGDLVDLVFTSKTDSTGGVYSALVVQQVFVLSLDRNPDDEEEVLVTLLVTLDQALQVSLAKRTGDLDLVLNPPDPGRPTRIPPISPLQFANQGADDQMEEVAEETQLEQPAGMR